MNRASQSSAVNMAYPIVLITSRKYGISDSTYYKWNKEFIEAGKARLDGDIVREATSDEVKELRQENIRLKEALADLVVRYDVVKKSLKLIE